MKTFTNEIVFRGHPDKVCDQISGAILNACLEQDRKSRVAVETAIKNEKVWIFGEITTTAKVNYKAIAKRVIKEIGYNEEYIVSTDICTQSLDISQGVDNLGAGDNGIMFGYACDDNDRLLPQAQVILQKFAKEYDKLAHKKPKLFYPDGKAEITATYSETGELERILSFTVCYCNPETNRKETDLEIERIVHSLCSPEKILINPTGKFNIGGSFADAGLTGRKIVVDAYQGFARVGGGCMNGKDPSKVDLTGAYMARQIAKETLRKHHLKWCEVQVGYAIGKQEPLSISIDSDKGEIEPTKDMYENSKPSNMIKNLNMLYLDYEEAAKWGHFH